MSSLYNFREITKILSQIESDKASICCEWVNTEILSEIFSRTGLDKKKFETIFAIKVIEYFLSIVKYQEKIGNCPAMNSMLSVFHGLNIGISDVYMICTSLKNTLNKVAITSSNEKLFNEINNIFDNNLKGVIDEYLYIHYPPSKKSKKVKTHKSKPEVVYEDFYKNKMSAQSFLEVEFIDSELIDDLNDFEKDFEALFSEADEIDSKILDGVHTLLSFYVSILRQIEDFKELNSHIIYFKNVLEQIDVNNITKEENRKYSTITHAVLSDLIKWKNQIFIAKDAKDIHYLDDSLLSSIKQLEMVGSTVNHAEDELEFF